MGFITHSQSKTHFSGPVRKELMVAVIMTMLGTPPTLWLRGKWEARLGFAYSCNFSPILDSEYYNPDKSILPAYDGTQNDLILRLPVCQVK